MICTTRLSRPLRDAHAILLAAALTTAVSVPSAEARKRGQENAPPPELSFTAPARLAVVSTGSQHVTFYNAVGESVRAPISSGQKGIYDTPVGVYSILQKKVDHTSNIYDDAKMPFMQRITWSGVALHAGALPGHPASHGCVRLPERFAGQIFDKTNLGLRVVISRDDVAPAAIDHPLLFQPRAVVESAAHIDRIAYTMSNPPLMPDVAAWPDRLRQQNRLKDIAGEKEAAAKAATEKADALKKAYEQKAAENKKALRPLRSAEGARDSAKAALARAEKRLASGKKPKAIARAEDDKAKTQATLEQAEARLKSVSAEVDPIVSALAVAKATFEAADAAKSKAVEAAKEAERDILPISVFVSLTTQRLYIRQGHSPVMDVPVTIRDPNRPIGTHIYTALDYTPDGGKARWNAVSLARFENAGPTKSTSRKRRGEETAASADAPASGSLTATAALDRITLPEEVKDRLNKNVWPGSSLIISDEPMHKKETNNFTDFIVLVSGYPQGGIKRRPPPPKIQFDVPFANDGFFFWGPPPPPQRLPPPRYRGRPPASPKFGWW